MEPKPLKTESNITIAATGIPTAKELTLDIIFITESDFLDEKYLLANNNGNFILYSSFLSSLSSSSIFFIYSNESSRKNANSGKVLS